MKVFSDYETTNLHDNKLVHSRTIFSLLDVVVAVAVAV